MSKYIVCALLFVAGVAPAADVYRCGPDGRSYSDRPCAEGRALEVADARSAEQVAEAADVAARDRRLTRQLAAERRAIEREQATLPAGFRVSPPLAPTKQARSKPLHDLQPHPHRRHAKSRPPGAGDDTFRATAPASRRVKD